MTFHLREQDFDCMNATLLPTEQEVRDAVDVLVRFCHGKAVANGWWHDLHTGESLLGRRNYGEMMMLAVSELAESMEAWRKGLNDEKLPHRPGAEVELADLIIRVCDTAGAHGFDLPGALVEKARYNDIREDHRPENRRRAGGKRC